MYPETRGLADSDQRSQSKMKMRVEFAPGDGCDFDELVSALSDAYEKLYAWNAIVSQAELDSIENGHSRETPVKQLSSYSSSMVAEDRAHVEKLQPDFSAIEITGTSGPLARLHWYFQNRHVDWDRGGKEPSEDRRLELEEQRTDAVREQVDLLHNLGFPEIQIREALSTYVFAPLDRLERCAEIKFVLPQQTEGLAELENGKDESGKMKSNS
jgi:hypothetical protein